MLTCFSVPLKPTNSTKLPSIELVRVALVIRVFSLMILFVMVLFVIMVPLPIDTWGPMVEFFISAFSPIKQGSIILLFCIMAFGFMRFSFCLINSKNALVGINSYIFVSAIEPFGHLAGSKANTFIFHVFEGVSKLVFTFFFNIVIE